MKEFFRLLVASTINVQKMLRQQRDIACSLPQWRQVDNQDIEPKEQVLAKDALRNKPVQGNISCRNNTDIGVYRTFSAKGAFGPDGK